MISTTCIAPVNIAVIKYWGKRDEKLILPYNDSISGTISMEEMCARTTVATSPEFVSNKFWLNGIEKSFIGNLRMRNCIKALKELASKKKADGKLLKQKLHISSINNFPTAAGLASSAAGYACLVYTIACLYGIEGEDLSIIARQGSGSACRSIHGGFVHWTRGELDDGSDSVAVQLSNEHHWPEMRVLILVVNDTKKKVSSTNGMSSTAQNSELFKYRIDHVVGKRVEAMQKCIAKKDFETFAELTMKDSNQFHAVCLDSYPPLVYMNDVSHKIVQLVHLFNKHYNAAKVAYTFDAGPNACLYMLEPELSDFITILNVAFPSNGSHRKSYVRGIPVKYKTYKKVDVADVIGKQVYEKDLLKYMIVTKLGEGAKKLLDPELSLLGVDGLPKKIEPPLRDESQKKNKKSKKPALTEITAVANAVPLFNEQMVIKSEPKIAVDEDIEQATVATEIVAGEIAPISSAVETLSEVAAAITATSSTVTTDAATWTIDSAAAPSV